MFDAMIFPNHLVSHASDLIPTPDVRASHIRECEPETFAFALFTNEPLGIYASDRNLNVLT
jgi:hypothetical protein